MSIVLPMSPRRRFLAALHNQQPDRVPVFDWITNRSLYERQTGRRPVGFEGRLAVRLNRSLGLDAVWAPTGGFPGLSHGVEPLTWLDDDGFLDEWGIRYRVSADSWPLAFAVESPVKDAVDWQQLKKPDPSEPWRQQYVRDARAELDGVAGEDLALVAGIRGPFSSLFILMGLAGISYALFEAPDLIDEMLDAFASFWTSIGQRLIDEHLVDAIVIHEDMGSNTATFLSPKHMRKYVLPHLRREVEALAGQGTPIILHSCGNINALLPDLMSMPFAGLNNLQRGASMDIAAIKAEYGERICLIGNVDASDLLPYGNRNEIEAAVVNCLRIAAPGGGFILASDHSLHDGIPLENVDAFIAAGKAHGAYPLSLPA